MAGIVLSRRLDRACSGRCSCVRALADGRLGQADCSPDYGPLLHQEGGPALLQEDQASEQLRGLKHH